MRGIVGLNQRFTGLFAASRSADDLRDEVEGALVGTVIVQIQGSIGGQYADQCDAREVVPLCDHLRAEQNIGIAGAEPFQKVAVCRFGRGCIGVHPHDPRLGKAGLQLLLHALRAKADVLQRMASAFRTCLRNRLPVSAVMAEEHAAEVASRLLHRVVRQGHAAMRTGQNLSAQRTGEEVVIAAPVDEQNGLLFPLQPCRKLFFQNAPDRGDIALLRVLPQIDHADGGERGGAIALCQADQRIDALLCLAVAFDRGSCGGKQHQSPMVGAPEAGNVARVVFGVHV